MHRDPLLSLIEHYSEKFPREHQTISKYRSFIESNPQCFERSLEEGHITCAAWILDRSEKRVLLTHHRKLNRWLQLGGHADGDPDVHRVAAREACEESGISSLELVSREIMDLDIHKIPERGNVPEHLHYDARFLFRATENEKYQISEESHDLAWVQIHNIQEFTSEESILRMAHKTKEFVCI
jgi:8-oxo-dGTP pyrophosphatase MutT (NUDIX family)